MENGKKILMAVICVLVLVGTSQLASAEEVISCDTPSSCQDIAEELVVLGVANDNDNIGQLTDFMLINGANEMLVIVRDNGVLDGGATSQNLRYHLDFHSNNRTYTFHDIHEETPDRTFRQQVYNLRPGGKR